MSLFLQLLGNGIAQGAVAMLYAAGFGFVCLAENAYGGFAPQLTDGDVFWAEVSLKALEVALKDPEVALKDPEVALKGAEVALKWAEVALIGPEVARKKFLPHLVCAGHAGRNGTYCLVRPRQRGRLRKNARNI